MISLLSSISPFSLCPCICSLCVSGSFLSTIALPFVSGRKNKNPPAIKVTTPIVMNGTASLNFFKPFATHGEVAAPIQQVTCKNPIPCDLKSVEYSSTDHV